MDRTWLTHHYLHFNKWQSTFWQSTFRKLQPSSKTGVPVCRHLNATDLLVRYVLPAGLSLVAIEHTGDSEFTCCRKQDICLDFENNSRNKLENVLNELVCLGILRSTNGTSVISGLQHCLWWQKTRWSTAPASASFVIKVTGLHPRIPFRQNTGTDFDDYVLGGDHR